MLACCHSCVANKYGYIQKAFLAMKAVTLWVQFSAVKYKTSSACAVCAKMHTAVHMLRPFHQFPYADSRCGGEHSLSICAQNCTVLYCTVLHCSVLLHCIFQYCTGLHYFDFTALLHCTPLNFTTVHGTVFHCNTQHHTAQLCTKPPPSVSM